MSNKPRWYSLPGVPTRSPEQISMDRAMLADYFLSKRTEPTQEEIAAYCMELKTSPEWIQTFFATLDKRSGRAYGKPVHKMFLPDS